MLVKSTRDKPSGLRARQPRDADGAPGGRPARAGGAGGVIDPGVLMEDLAHTHNFACVDGEPCRRYQPGHHTHSIHWARAARSPELFRDAIVREMEGHRVAVEYLDGGSGMYWNHEVLATLLRPGDPVSVHSQYHLLRVGSRCLNLSTTADLSRR